MNISINVSTLTLKEAANTAIEAATTITGEVDMASQDKLYEALYLNKEFEAMGVSGSYSISNGVSTFTMDIDNEVIEMALPLVLKIGKVLAPIYNLGKMAIGLLENSCDQLKAAFEEYGGKIEKRFGRPTKYAVVKAYSADLEIRDVAVIADNGFGNRWIERLYYAGSNKDFELGKSIAFAKLTDDLFSEISRDKAIELAEMIVDQARAEAEERGEE